MPAKRICKVCQKVFFVCPAQAKRNRGKYCSIKCRDEAQRIRIKRICVACKKEFWVWPHVLKLRPCLYCSLKCRNLTMTKEKHGMWKGGTYKKPQGYIMQYIGIGQYQRQHRLIVEQALSRPLTDDEIVHHINGNVTDNTQRNLSIMSRAEHIKLHDPRRWRKKKKCQTKTL